MLVERDQTAEFPPSDDGLAPQSGRLRAEHGNEVKRPLPRDVPPETKQRPARPLSEPGRDAGTRGDGTTRRNKSRRALRASLAALLLVPVAGASYLYWDNARHYETTDDAFIAARQFAVAPKVSGYLTAVPVTDNEHVTAGEVIARIDVRDYRIALAKAEGEVAAANASIENIDAQIGVQQAQVAQNQWQIGQAQAGLTFDQQQAARYQDLARTGAGTVQSAQQWLSQRLQQQASVKAAEATLVATVRQLAVLKAQRDSADANLQQAIAQRDQARLNLSYATVTAAQPGRIVQLSAAVGQYASVGTDLAMFVPDDIWVVANFKENQLDRIRPGQPVTLRIDAYPEHAVLGHVASVQPGSGTAFSLLPAENATGNYVKIVQRVPVKILLDNPPTDVALGPGMSAEPTVRVDPGPSLIERLARVL
ncbi:MAG TPA: HlyD family secretion protein [Acetobacteraceae bacterium]|nr:HlyD family secretion protein [Acetobacteraceae bacterium]